MASPSDKGLLVSSVSHSAWPSDVVVAAVEWTVDLFHCETPPSMIECDAVPAVVA